jgi:hypothetical protein
LLRCSARRPDGRGDGNLGDHRHLGPSAWTRCEPRSWGSARPNRGRRRNRG